MARLLLIEDDDSLRESLVNYLSKEGYDIDLASNVKSAIDKLCTQTDLMIFPRKSGHYFKRLKQNLLLVVE